MRKLSLFLATLALAALAPVRARTVKDGLLILPYAAKAVLPAVLLVPERTWFDPGVQAALGLAILATTVPDLMILGSLARRNPAALRDSRRLAFYGEMAASIVYLGAGVLVLGRGQRGDEIGFLPLALCLPMLLLAQLNHIPFDAEDEAPPPASGAGLRIRIPF